jgi:AhpD family alkylhydroperoxidase
MAGNSKEFVEEFEKNLPRMKEAAPDAVLGFGGLFQRVMKDGALSLREKELIALAIGIALRCDPCINLHVKKCLDAGATREQIIEAASVVTMMQGGPGYTYLPYVVDALDAFGA